MEELIINISNNHSDSLNKKDLIILLTSKINLVNTQKYNQFVYIT